MKQLLVTIVVFYAAISLFAADHFPVKQGNIWIFSYKHTSGGWGSSTTISGTIKWEIIGTTQAEDSTTVTIRQTTSVSRRIFTPGEVLPHAGIGYDSTYIPSKIVTDTLLLIDNKLGLSFSDKSCYSFVHDTKTIIPESQLSIRDTTVLYAGQTIEASIIDPLPCSGDVTDYSYYITAQGIGPVRYHMNSSPYLQDAFWSENRELMWTNVSNYIVGTCIYSKYIGTAVITRVQRQATSTNEYSVFFKFFTDNTIQESGLITSINTEKNISAISGIENKMATYHIKPGNTYVCTLDVITTGTCTPLIYHLKPPTPTDNIDTSSLWIDPDSVVENMAFGLNLLGYEFNCYTRFSHEVFTFDNNRIQLTYLAAEIPAGGICLPAAKLYGIAFDASALPHGKYPVFSARHPVCYPGCTLPIVVTQLDTLQVTPQTVIINQHQQTQYHGVETRIYQNNNQIVFDGIITKPGIITGSLYNLNGVLLKVIKSGWLPAERHHVVLTDNLYSETATGNKAIILNCSMPDGNRLSTLLIKP